MAPPSEPDFDDEVRSTAVIWQGARHAWTYNHRLNRLGNWVGPLRCEAGACEADLVHAAASGLGSDVAEWSARATAVHAADAAFRQGNTRVLFDVPQAEGELVSEQVEVRIPAVGALADREQHHVVLAGYDVYALGDADKFHRLDLEVGDVRTQGADLVFDVDVGLQLDCDSVECDGTWNVGAKLRRRVTYGVDVRWLLVGANDDALQVESILVGRSYAWDDDRGDELDAEVGRIDVARPGPPIGFATPIPAFQALSIELDRAHHMVEWATLVRPTKSGLEVDLLFKAWNEKTAQKWVSFGHAGSATTSARVVELAFRDASLTVFGGGGELEWRANNGPATGGAAENAHAVAFDGLVEAL